MELWIRSQDREKLVKVINLKIINCHNESIYEKNFTFDIIDESRSCLGKYESKERALEVLDEIQNILHPKIIVKKSEEELGNLKLEFAIKEIESFSYDIEQLNTYVYKMPKE